MYDHNGEVAEFTEDELRPTLKDEAIEFFKWIFAGEDSIKKISISITVGFIAGIAITLLIK